MTFCATRWEQLAPLVERAAVVLLVGHQGVIRAFRLHADGSARVRFEDGYEVQVPSVKETM